MSPRVNLIQDTAAGFVTKNPILRAGDLGIETDTGLSKFGDGINSWTALPYYPYDSSSGLFRNQLAVSSGSVLGTIPGRVHPAERLLKEAVWWIDAKHSTASGQSVRNLGWGGSALNAQLGSSGSADSNDPRYLDWTGENYVYLPGVTGNYLSVPDANNLDITGDLDIRVKVAPVSVNSGSYQNLLFKQSAYQFYINNSGLLELQGSLAAGGTFGGSGSAPSLTAETAVWLRATRVAATGLISFYKSTDGASWSAVGTYSHTSGNIATSSAVVGIGETTYPMAGSFYRAIVKNGIDGPSVLDIDCSQISSGGATSFRALTGQTVTINRTTSGRKTVAVTQPCWLFGTDDYMQVADNDLLDFGATDSFSVISIYRAWSATTANFNGVISKASATSTAGWLQYTNLNPNIVVSSISDGGGATGDSAAAGSSEPISGGQAVKVTVVDRIARTLTQAGNGTLGAATSIESIGSVANSTALLIGARGGAGYATDMEGIAFAIFRRALTPAEIALINTYYQSRG